MSVLLVGTFFVVGAGSATSSARDRVMELRPQYEESFKAWRRTQSSEKRIELVRLAADLIHAYDAVIKESASDERYTVHTVADAENNIVALRTLSDQVQWAAVEQYVYGLRYLMDDVRSIVAVSGNTEAATRIEKDVDEVYDQFLVLRQRYKQDQRLGSILLLDVYSLLTKARRAHDMILALEGIQEIGRGGEAPDIKEAPRQTTGGVYAQAREINEYLRYLGIRTQWFSDALLPLPCRSIGGHGKDSKECIWEIEKIATQPEAQILAFTELQREIAVAPVFTQFPMEITWLSMKDQKIYAEDQLKWEWYKNQVERAQSFKGLNDVLEEFGKERRAAIETARALLSK